MSTTPPSPSSTASTTQPQSPPSAPQDSPAQPQAPPARQPWDIQHGETQEAFSAFTAYLHHGPQITLEEFAAETNRNYASVRHFSQRHHWRERAAAYRQDEAQHQAESLRKATDASNALLLQRTAIFQQQQWERAHHLTDLAEFACDLALKGKEVPPRLNHVAQLYNTVDKLGQRAVQPPPAALLPTPADQPLSPEAEMTLNKIFGPITASGILPEIKALLERAGVIRLPKSPESQEGRQPPESPAASAPAPNNPTT